MIYAVYKNNRNEIIFEQFEERTWEFVKQRQAQILYVSQEIDDPEFQKYKLKTMVWDRFVSPMSHAKERIVVNYVPEDISKMKEEAETILAKKNEMVSAWKEEVKKSRDEKYIRNLPKKLESQRYHAQMLSENDKLFEDLTTEYEILSKWNSLGFIMPPPTKVMEIKKTDFPGKNWEEFKEIVAHICS